MAGSHIIQLTKWAIKYQEWSEDERGIEPWLCISDLAPASGLPSERLRPSSSFSPFGGPGPPSPERVAYDPSKDQVLDATTRGSLGIAGEAVPPHFLENSSLVEKQIHLKDACKSKKVKNILSQRLSPPPALLGGGHQYLEHRLRLAALLDHVHSGPATPLVVPDALGHLRSLQPLESVAVGATPLVDVL